MSLDVLFAQLTSTKFVLPFYGDSSLFQADDSDLEKSKTYNWNGARMTADIGGAVPIIYGRHIIAPNLVNVFIEEGENDTLNMLLAVCEGEIEGISNIKINGNPIENYYGEAANDPYGENAEITVRKGAIDQETIWNFGDIHNIVLVGHTLRQGITYEYTTARADVEAFQIELRSEKLYQLDDNDNKLAWYYSVQIEYKLHTETEWKFLGVHEVSKKADSPFTRHFKSDYLPPGQYDIKVTKVSTDPGALRVGEVILNTIDEITTQNLIYPSTALLGLRLVASEKLAENLPNVTCIVTGTKVRVPDVRDGEGNPVSWEDYFWDAGANCFKSLAYPDLELNWDGSYTTAWSGNPVWCLRDLLTNRRYGLGDFIKEENIDEASFLEAAKYCDEGVDNMDGKKEKRMQLDFVLDRKTRALDALHRICSIFRGLLHVSSGRIRLVIEKQQQSVLTFNMSNIIKDSFSIKYISKKAAPNVLQLSYTNKDKDYKRDNVEIGDEASIAVGEEVRQKTVQFIGCTRLSQALREGMILLKKLKYNTTQIAFRTGMDAFTCQVGDIFGFQHDLPAWGQGGRVKYGSTSTKVKLDKKVVLELGKTYELEVRNIQSDKIERRTIAETDGAYDEVHVNSPFTFQPTEYDLWTFGEQSYVNKLYRAVSLTKEPHGRISVTAIEYNADVYDYTGITIPEDDYKYLTLDIPNVSNLTAEEKVTRLPDGTIDDVINVSYTKPPISARWVKRVTRVEIYLSDDNGTSWNFIGETDKEFYTIRESFTKGTRYTVAVVSVTEEREKRVPANSPKVSLTIEGWKKPPAQVSNFAYKFEDEIKLFWNRNLEGDLAGYEIRTESYNWGIQNDYFIWRGNAENYIIIRPEARAGITYYIKAYNTSGVYSDSYAYITPINPAPEALALTYTNVFQKVFLTWQDSTDVDLVEYQIWQNDSDIWHGYGQANEKLIHKSKGTSAMMLIPYDPTYYRVRGVDKFGAGEWSNPIRVSQLTLEGVDISPEAIDSVHILDESIIAPKIAAGAIQAAHISALAVTAEKINVACLSAISANLGCITAGIIIGACIKTSNQDYRTELNNAGLFSYDCDGIRTIKLADGNLCLINPACCDFYSFLDHGALKFHHPYGSVPYAKRMCSGTACAGSTITLCQWYERPEATVGIRKLMAYNSAHAESCQDWCVYADNFRWFDCGGPDFGWKFDVHAKLVLSGGTRDECIYLVDFDVNETTGVDTCLVLVKEMFQLWYHGQAPDTFKYGLDDFEVRWRTQGCGVWCACCYQYTQPHGSVSQITTTNIACQTIHLGAGNVYEVQIHRNNLTWYDSGIPSGVTCCYLCCFQYCCSYWVTCCYWCCYQYTVDCSYWYWQTHSANCTVAASSWSHECSTEGTFYQIFDDSVIIAGYPQNTYWSCVLYKSCGVVQHMRWTPDDPSWACSCIDGCGRCAGGRWVDCVSWVDCRYHSEASAIGKICNLETLYVRGRRDPTWGFWSPGWAKACGTIWDICVYYCFCTCEFCCFLCCCWGGCWVYECCQIWCVYWCCYWYCCYYGAPATCIYEKFYSMTETSSLECILDPYGQINYLAVAYA